MGPKFFLLIMFVCSTSAYAGDRIINSSQSFLDMLQDRPDAARLLGFPEVANVVVHLGYQNATYANLDDLKKVLTFDIRSRPADTVHVFYLTSRGLSAELVELFASEELKNHGRVLVVVSQQNRNDVLHNIADLFANKKENYHQINLDNGHRWEDFISGFITKISRKGQLENSFKTEILMKEGSDSELRSVLNILARSRFQKNLNEIDVELGMGFFPRRGSNLFQLAATNLASLSDSIAEVNRYLNFSSLVLVTKENSTKTLLSKSPFGIVRNSSVSSDRELVQEQIDDFTSGQAHHANSFSYDLNEKSAKVHVKLNERSFMIRILAGESLYEDLIENDLKASVWFHGPSSSESIILDPSDWKVIGSEGDRFIIEADRNFKEVVVPFLPNPGLELILHQETHSPRTATESFSWALEDFDLLSTSQQQKDLAFLSSVELIKSEIIAVANHIEDLGVDSQYSEVTLKPRNQKFTGDILHYSSDVEALRQYRRYLILLNTQLADDRKRVVSHQPNCAALFAE